MSSAIARAFARSAPSPASRASAAARDAASRSAKGIGGGPAPRLRATSPQKCWSPKKGTTSVGSPARSDASSVPAPPWCTAAAHRGISQPWGQGPSARTRGDAVAAPAASDQPLWKSTRTSAASAAATTVSQSAAGSSTTMDPKPTSAGFSPAARNAASALGGS